MCMGDGLLMCGGDSDSGYWGGNGSFDFIKGSGGDSNKIITCDLNGGKGVPGWGGSGNLG